MANDPYEGWSDQQRMELCNKCVEKVNAQNNLPGIKFIIDALQLNIPSALIDWGKMFITKAGSRADCLECLTPEQRDEVVRQWQKDKQAIKDLPKFK